MEKTSVSIKIRKLKFYFLNLPKQAEELLNVFNVEKIKRSSIKLIDFCRFYLLIKILIRRKII
ncbi:hypothetical protein IEQ34_001892 [Dendrobium chrysotoxum]|uniref:Uncharacterized protein n=1 Tax=Dendrobium chrysotoxum TaxID=161865 RepID=A0AAV7H3H0_DENCH|nr:hypothetical protein IEQ34_001892 [Dendrobium chrysotoxum]